MPTIEFLRDRVLRDEHEGTDAQTKYRKGQRIAVSELSAKHWIDRGAAVEVTDQKRQPAKTDKEPAGDK